MTIAKFENKYLIMILQFAFCSCEVESVFGIVEAVSHLLMPSTHSLGLQTCVQLMHNRACPRTSLVNHQIVEQLKIPLEELVVATNNITEIIGHGGFGTVYKGQSEKYGSIAVKKLDPNKDQGNTEFHTEVALLSLYKHENIVCLIGFCEEQKRENIGLQTGNTWQPR